MIFVETEIKGLNLLKPKIMTDDRGYFIKIFHSETFMKHGFNEPFIESYFSSSAKGVIRGMHFQTPPCHHVKLVYVPKGSVQDVVLDLRKESATYGKYYTQVLSDRNGYILLIPKGCAHGFLSLENETIMTYMQTTMYAPENDSGVRYDSFGFDWKVDFPIVSERDMSFAVFADFKTPFCMSES